MYQRLRWLVCASLFVPAPLVLGGCMEGSAESQVAAVTSPDCVGQPIGAECRLPTGALGVCRRDGACIDLGSVRAPESCGALQVFCDDGNECTQGYCQGVFDRTCSISVPTPGLRCGVNGTCTFDGTCEEPNLCDSLDCDDGNPCTTDSCDRTLEQCVNIDASCDDGNDCTEDSCDPATGECSYDEAGLGTPCGGSGFCGLNGECRFDFCDGQDCDDGNECTLDRCLPLSGICVNPPVLDGTDCGDGGTCLLGRCEADIVDCDRFQIFCDDGNECTQGLCGAFSNTCRLQLPLPFASCGEGGRCRFLDGEIQCVNEDVCSPEGCDDDNDCTDDVCNDSTGQCVTSAVLDGSPCNEGEGVCVSGTCETDVADCGLLQIFCDDGNECTQGICGVLAPECRFQIPILGKSCGVNGRCRFDGGEIRCVDADDPCGDCDDGNECTQDSCDELAGRCQHLALAGQECDGGICDELGDCSGLTCDNDCDDQNECTSDSCLPLSNLCVNTPLVDGTSCAGGAGTCVLGDCFGIPQTVRSEVRCQTLLLRNEFAHIPFEVTTVPLGPVRKDSTVLLESIGEILITEAEVRNIFLGLVGDVRLVQASITLTVFGASPQTIVLSVPNLPIGIRPGDPAILPTSLRSTILRTGNATNGITIAATRASFGFELGFPFFLTLPFRIDTDEFLCELRNPEGGAFYPFLSL